MQGEAMSREGLRLEISNYKVRTGALLTMNHGGETRRGEPLKNSKGNTA